jgi:hypothetical protein
MKVTEGVSSHGGASTAALCAPASATAFVVGSAYLT